MNEQIDGCVRLAQVAEGDGHGEDDLRRRREEPWSVVRDAVERRGFRDFGEGRARWREGDLEIWGRRDILLARLLFPWQRALFFVSAVRWVTICAGS